MKKEIEEIEKKLDEISSKLEFIYFNSSCLFIDNNTEYIEPSKEKQEIQRKLRKEYNQLNRQLDYLYHIDFAINNNPIIVNDVLDLYLENYDEDNFASQYIIFRHDTKDYVGKIKYSGEKEEYFGNVSYKIDEKYRGNNYALMALKLMSTDLYKKGVEELLISAKKDNIASIKTIEKFGGGLIENDGFVVRYKCDLKLIQSKENNKR